MILLCPLLEIPGQWLGKRGVDDRMFIARCLLNAVPIVVRLVLSTVRAIGIGVDRSTGQWLIRRVSCGSRVEVGVVDGIPRRGRVRLSPVIVWSRLEVVGGLWSLILHRWMPAQWPAWLWTVFDNIFGCYSKHHSIVVVQSSIQFWFGRGLPSLRYTWTVLTALGLFDASRAACWLTARATRGASVKL